MDIDLCECTKVVMESNTSLRYVHLLLFIDAQRHVSDIHSAGGPVLTSGASQAGGFGLHEKATKCGELVKTLSPGYVQLSDVSIDTMLSSLSVSFSGIPEIIGLIPEKHQRGLLRINLIIHLLVWLLLFFAQSEPLSKQASK